MTTRVPISHRSMLFVLHPVFALTGVADAIAGPMLPSLARVFHLSDSESGVLLFSLFAGMAVGALLCRGDYARILTRGLLAMAITCAAFPWVPRSLLYPFGFFAGRQYWRTHDGNQSFHRPQLSGSPRFHSNRAELCLECWRNAGAAVRSAHTGYLLVENGVPGAGRSLRDLRPSPFTSQFAIPAKRRARRHKSPGSVT